VIPLPLSAVEPLGRLDAASDTDLVTGVKIDSRLIEAGDLFVAVGAGTEFVADARERGAAATLVPDDPFAAMATIGRSVRVRSRAHVVGITGSTGKTSTKDILAALCAPVARTVAAEASYNNELGVPLTLCRLEEDTEVCVLELAMRGLGQIAYLAEIAKPDVGVITSVGPAHLELVGSLAAVAEAKAELLAALPAGAPAVVPDNVPDLEPHLRSDLDVRRFGRDQILDFRIVDNSVQVRYRVGGRELELPFNFTARHHALNALAALHAYDALGLPLADARRGSSQIAFSRWRGDEIPLPGGGVLINDAYNANPISMNAAIDHLVERAQGRRSIAVLGEMAELGAEAPAYHREIGVHAAGAGVDLLIAVGPLAREYLDAWSEDEPGAVWVPTVEAAQLTLADLLQPGDCVLVKASRAAGLEAVALGIAGVAA
jgi:UDP-N-acetylmuramoyl-tripeptide--D-alanyl-D-alanine ligase